MQYNDKVLNNNRTLMCFDETRAIFYPSEKAVCTIFSINIIKIYPFAKRIVSVSNIVFKYETTLLFYPKAPITNPAFKLLVFFTLQKS
jgi:hypothetical protein